MHKRLNAGHACKQWLLFQSISTKYLSSSVTLHSSKQNLPCFLTQYLKCKMLVLFGEGEFADISTNGILLVTNITRVLGINDHILLMISNVKLPKVNNMYLGPLSTAFACTIHVENCKTGVAAAWCMSRLRSQATDPYCLFIQSTQSTCWFRV